jgi:hypothetical protein
MQKPEVPPLDGKILDIWAQAVRTFCDKIDHGATAKDYLRFAECAIECGKNLQHAGFVQGVPDRHDLLYVVSESNFRTAVGSLSRALSLTRLVTEDASKIISVVFRGPEIDQDEWIGKCLIQNARAASDESLCPVTDKILCHLNSLATEGQSMTSGQAIQSRQKILAWLQKNEKNPTL